MKSMQSVPSSLIARNESWVRKQASSLARRMPSNVEKADLIQAGLIAVAQSALAFKWEGDRDSEDAREAFVRYARLRVKGAMLDELRQMDQLPRAQRRQIKAIQIARERWQASNGVVPTLAELSAACGIEVDEISRLEQAAQMVQTQSLEEPDASEERAPIHPATAKDEVEARVDTAILMRRLASYFATLPERDRQVIDAYLGVGMTPVELAKTFKVTPSRISQMYGEVCRKIVRVMGTSDQQRATDRRNTSREPLDELIALRERELAQGAGHAGWGELIEQALTRKAAERGMEDVLSPEPTRWG